jgi:Zn-finger nucleic acid-binding protein
VDGESARQLLEDRLGLSATFLKDLCEHFAGPSHPCPGCGYAMGPVQIRGQSVELCQGCGGLWCDPDELEGLTGGMVAEAQSHRKTTRAINAEKENDLASPEDGASAKITKLRMRAAVIGMVVAFLVGLIVQIQANQARKNQRGVEDKSPQAIFQRGKKILKEGHINAALDMAKLLKREHPNLHQGHHLLGLVLIKKQKWVRADNAFHEALTMNPGHLESHRQGAWAAHKAGRTLDSATHADAWLKHRPDDAWMLHMRGHARSRRGEYQPGQADLKRACTLGRGEACNEVKYFKLQHERDLRRLRREEKRTKTKSP